jgi:hypothetical protein
MGFNSPFNSSGGAQILTDLEVDGTTLVVDEANNRVGIGVAAPTYALEVAGNVGFNEYLYHNDDADTYIHLTADRLDIVCGGVELIRYYEGTSDYVHVNAARADVNFVVDTSGEYFTFFVDGALNKIGMGTNTPKTRLTVEGTITLKEQAEADADADAYGQIWVNTATPCELWFTDDAGTDTQLGTGGGAAANDLDHILHQQVFS